MPVGPRNDPAAVGEDYRKKMGDSVRKGLAIDMKSLRRFRATTAMLAAVTAPAWLTKPMPAPIVTHVSHEFGTPLADDYRWMEKPASRRLGVYLRAQNAYTRAVLAAIPGRRALAAQLAADADSGPQVFNVTRAAGKTFAMQMAPGQNTAHLVVFDRPGAKPRLLINPMRFSEHRAPQALNYYFGSPDGRHVAFGGSAGGSEQATLRVLDVTSGKLRRVAITRVDGDDGDFPPVAWLPDSKGFVYYRLHRFAIDAPVSDFYQQSRDFLHLLSSRDASGAGDAPVFGWKVAKSVPMSPAEDALVVTEPDSHWALGILTQNEEIQSTDAIYASPLADLEAGHPVWRPVLVGANPRIAGFALHGDRVDVISPAAAPRFRVIEYDIAGRRPPTTVVPPGREVITSLAAGRHALYVGAMRDGMGRILRVADGGAIRELPMPFQGGLGQILADPSDRGVWFRLSGWTTPAAWYAYDPTSGVVTDTGLQNPPAANVLRQLADIEAIEVKAPSWDGTMIPVSIILRKGTVLDGRRPTLLIGYGSYGLTLTPSFNPLALPWLERGGVLAIAHVRGGGWYGDAWHRAGEKQWKINTVFDFIAAAQYLIDHRYTSPARLGGEGGSAGGITIGGAIAWRPDLFAAAIDSHGDTNTLRAQFTPNGPPNEVEFGNVTRLPDFHWLYAMDAMAHIRNGVKYPALMCVTGINDPRIEPWEVAKFAARVAAATASDRPVLLRVSYRSGHGIGSTKNEIVRTMADQYAFLLWQFGVHGFQPTQSISR